MYEGFDGIYLLRSSLVSGSLLRSSLVGGGLLRSGLVSGGLRTTVTRSNVALECAAHLGRCLRLLSAGTDSMQQRCVISGCAVQAGTLSVNCGKNERIARACAVLL